MSLPNQFESPREYFEECISFFEEYKDLYIVPNTDIFFNGVFDRINIENINQVDVFEDNFDLRELRNDYLDTFFRKLDRFKVVYRDEVKDDLGDDFDAPLSCKKKHEISLLTKEIRNQFGTDQSQVVVDFGSGLGYLDQKIYKATNCKVLGLESDENNYVGAKKRQRKYHLDSINNVKYIRHKITEESNTNILEYIKDKFGELNFGITGLHSCADLTIDAIDIFLKTESAKHLLMLSCCYHKMSLNIGGKFNNLPVSLALRNAFAISNAYEFINIPFLRLGAQPPYLTSSLEDAVFNLMARGVLQVYALMYNCKLRRKRRKPVNTKKLKLNFETYIKDACEGFRLCNTESSNEENKEQNTFDIEILTQLWRQTSNPMTLKKAAIFILLQNYMQPVIENFILFDRLVYLRENGINHCYYKKIFDDKVSPRCLALIAKK